MSLLAYVDYGFILVFFVVLLGTVLLIGLNQGKKATAVQKSSITFEKIRLHMFDYGVLVALFAVFVFIAFLTQKQRRITAMKERR
jgi:uncharacterized protein HemY